jgi:hypothetical protein
LVQEHLLKKPARDLTPKEAFELLLHHIEQGDIDLVDVKQARVDERGQPIYLRVNQNVRIRSLMAGVQYTHVSGDTRDFAPKPEFAILLLRLARWLSDSCGVVKIVWGGIGSGSGKNAVDCHTDGRCIDFYGAELANGRTFDVDLDWWQKPVPPKDGAKLPAKVGNDYWGDGRSTFFRLAPAPQQTQFWPGWFFGLVYEFAVKESTITSADIGVDAFRRGDALKAGAIFHPDHPVPGTFGKKAIPGRRNHFQHMHFGVGKAIG